MSDQDVIIAGTVFILMKMLCQQEGNKGRDGSKEQRLEGDTAKVKYRICGWRTRGICRTLSECS